MGRLLLFNKRIDLAADDLTYGAAYMLMLRIIWISIVSVMFIRVHATCGFGWPVELYTFIYIIVASVCLVNELVVLVVSMAGTVADKHPRRSMGRLGEIEVLLICIDCVCQGFGLWAVFFLPSVKGCPNATPAFDIVLVRAVSIWATITDVGFLAIFTTVMKLSRLRSKHDLPKYIKLWQRRIEYLFSGHSSKGQGKVVMTDIAKEFADFFQDFEDDWSYTDIAVGLILLKREQKIVRESLEFTRMIPVPWKAPRTRRLSEFKDHVKKLTHFNNDVAEGDKSSLESMSVAVPVDRKPSRGSIMLEYSPFPIGSSQPSLFTQDVKKSVDESRISTHPPKSTSIAEHPGDLVIPSPSPQESKMPTPIQEAPIIVTIDSPTSPEQSKLPLPAQEVPIIVNIKSKEAQEHDADISEAQLEIIPSPSPQESKMPTPIQEAPIIVTIDSPTSPEQSKLPLPAQEVPIIVNIKSKEAQEHDADIFEAQLEIIIPESSSVGHKTSNTNHKTSSNQKSRARLSIDAIRPSPAQQPSFLSPSAEGWGDHPRFNSAPTDVPEVITSHDIWDILHFSHYAELAYINFDHFETLKELVISTSKKNDLFHAPFMISYDHDWKCIVISIRGTYSTADFLVDLKFDLVQLDPDGDNTLMAHSGMLETAKNLLMCLDQQQVLQKYRSGKYVNYRVVICGHSLGGVNLLYIGCFGLVGVAASQTRVHIDTRLCIRAAWRAPERNGSCAV